MFTAQRRLRSPLHLPITGDRLLGFFLSFPFRQLILLVFRFPATVTSVILNRDFASRKFTPFSVSQDWRGSSPSIPVTTMVSSHESASVVSSTWTYPYGFPSVQNSPSGSGPFPFGQKCFAVWLPTS